MKLSEDLQKRIRQQRNYLIFLTILMIVGIIIMAVLYFVYNLKEALWYLILFIILLCLLEITGWGRYYHQKRKDEARGNKRDNLLDRAIRVSEIAEGVNLRYYAIGYAIAALLFFLGGVGVLFFNPYPQSLLGVLFIVISIVLIYPILESWERSKIKLKGRDY